MEENNRKGPGIFYAVTGVATLIVAIIGATFAYFSATAEDENTIDGNIAAAGGLYLKVTNLAGTGKDIIPLNVNKNDTQKVDAEGQPIEGQYVDAVEQFTSAMTATTPCVDANGNQVCQVYAIEVANKSTTSTIMIQGTLALTSEAQNLRWKLIGFEENGSFVYDPEGTDDPETTDIDERATSTIAFVGANAKELDSYALDHVTAGTTAIGGLTVGGNSNGTKGDTELDNKTLGHTKADNSAVYYVLVWLEETGAAQENFDATKGYTGVVSFTAVDAAGQATGITATF